MNLYIIFGQRIERYPGEYAPEALEVMDEYGMEENGQWLEEKLEEHRKNTDFLGVSIFCIELPKGTQAHIRQHLLGEIKLQATRITALPVCPRCGRILNNISSGISVVAGGISVCTSCLNPGETEIARAREI